MASAAIPRGKPVPLGTRTGQPLPYLLGPRACEIILDKLFVYRVISLFRRGARIANRETVSDCAPARGRVPAVGGRCEASL